MAGSTVSGSPSQLCPDRPSPDDARARQGSGTDPALAPQYVTWPRPNGHGAVRGSLVRPPSDTPGPAVLVV